MPPEMTTTRFSATCSRLSQYLKEQQCLAATGPRPTTTMSLLPGFNVPTEKEADISDKPLMDLFPQHAGLGLTAPAEEKAKLTIFYGGQMLEFDDFPVDKAKNLMLMAEKGSPVDPPAAAAVSGLPFARRASLHRFIEKRKERIHSSNEQYTKDGSPAIAAALHRLPHGSQAPKTSLKIESFKY